MERRSRNVKSDPGREALSSCPKKKKKILREKKDKMARTQKQRLSFAFCQGSIHLALASLPAFSSKRQLQEPSGETQGRETDHLQITLNSALREGI